MSSLTTAVQPIRWTGDSLQLLDQRKLPGEVVYVECRTASDVARAIRDMVVRGAPAIGVAAAFGLALAAKRGEDISQAADELRQARPTAVNLAWAVDRALTNGGNLETLAKQMFDEDIEANRRIGRFGAALLGN